MGTGSFGGGGGGGGGAWRGGSGYHFEEGQLAGTAAVADPGTVREDAKMVLRKLPAEYLGVQFGSPLVRAAYEQLFVLASSFQQGGWGTVATRYGVSDEPGCLPEWVNAVIARARSTEPNQKVRETARVCLEDFLMRALDNDLDTYVTGSGEDIQAQLNTHIFASTSGYFLGALLWRVLERERERAPESVEAPLRQAAQEIADKVVDEFRRRFVTTGQAGYSELFRVIQENEAWLVGALRQ